MKLINLVERVLYFPVDFRSFELKKGLKSLVNRIKLLLIATLSVLKRVNLRSFVENARVRFFSGQIEFIQTRYINEICI